MVPPEDVVLAIFGGTSALGALVLVFLGMVAGNLDALKARNASSTVKRPYKITAGLTFAAFLLSITCAALSTWWLLLGQSHDTYLAIVWAFLAELAFLAVAAGRVFIDMIGK